jgi:hypothetical protein
MTNFPYYKIDRKISVGLGGIRLSSSHRTQALLLSYSISECSFSEKENTTDLKSVITDTSTGVKECAHAGTRTHTHIYRKGL